MTTALVFVAIAIFGIFSLMNLSINQLPNMETNFIMVMTSYPGASAADIETNISKTLENTLNAVPDLKHLSSTSRENTSVLSLEFESGIDIETATNNVRDKIDMVRNYLPDGATNPVLFKFNAEDMPIMLISVTADESLAALDKIIEDHGKYVIEGRPMPSYAYENFVETYEAYKALGGNGMAQKMFDEMKNVEINRKVS